MNQRNTKFWRGKGFYLALTLVVAGAALASFLAIDSMMTHLRTDSAQPAPIDGEETIPWNEEHTPADTPQEGVPEKETAPAASSSSSAPAARPSAGSSSAVSQPQPGASGGGQPASDAPAAQQTPSYVSPMTGQFLQAYSGDELVYNETLEDWRTHNGVDIAGAQHENVAAPMAAAVTFTAEDDPLWGGVVELQAANGTLVRLCGLDSVYVDEGQQVEQGKVIGLLGQVPCEGALERHLHVECVREGAYIDPAPLLGLEQDARSPAAGTVQEPDALSGAPARATAESAASGAPAAA